MEKHSLLLHVMLKQGTSWYALDNIDYMLPSPVEESEISIYISDGQQIEHYSGLRQLTLTLPADSVMVDIDVKMLKGQYTYSLNNNYTK